MKSGKTSRGQSSVSEIKTHEKGVTTGTYTQDESGRNHPEMDINDLKSRTTTEDGQVAASTITGELLYEAQLHL